MPFKKDIRLNGVDWCFNKPSFVKRGLAARYQKNAEVTFKINRKNPNTANACVGSSVIGFINEPDSKPIIDAIGIEERIYAHISGVVYSKGQNEQPAQVYVEVSTFPRRRKGAAYQEKSKPISKEKSKPISEKRKVTSAQSAVAHSHRITGEDFKEQRKKEDAGSQHYGKSGIYCIWNKNHETYIGQSLDIGRRISEHVRTLNAGKHNNHRLQADWKSYGHNYFRFDLVEIVSDRSKLSEREYFFIRKYETCSFGYNSTEKVEDFETKLTAAQQLHKTIATNEYVYLFDGRYMQRNFKRNRDKGIVRLWYGDEIWCYQSNSEHHAENLARWFANHRKISGSAYDWKIK